MRVKCVIGILILAMGLVFAVAGTRDGDVLIGDVRSVDDKVKTFNLVDNTGKEWTVTWDDQTSFLTRPRVGLKMKVTIEGTADSSRTLVATRVGMGEKKATP